MPTWMPTSTTIEDWGYLQVVYDGVDITWVRGGRTLIDGLAWGEPYGEQEGQLTIPLITEFDAFSGDLSWLKRGRNVDIWHWTPDDVRHPYWHGISTSFEITSLPKATASLSVQLLGALVGEASVRAHQPQMKDDDRDIGTILGQALRPEAYSRPLPGFRFSFTPDTTGILARKNGSRGQTVLTFVDEILAIAQDVNYQWTIARAFTTDYPTAARSYYLRPKGTPADPVQVNTVTIGTDGVEFTFNADVLAHPTTYYGEGLAKNGERWRNARYPGLYDNPVPAYPTRDGGSPISGDIQIGDVDGNFTTPAITVMQAELRSDGWPSVQVTGEFDDATLNAVQAASLDLDGAISNTVDSALWTLFFEKSTYTTELSSGYFRPIACKTTVEKYRYYADGSIKGLNPSYDPDILRVDTFIAYGERTNKKRGTRNSERLLNRDTATGDWSGKMTLRIDPEERSRLDIREGSCVVVKQALGQGEDGLTFNVAGMKVMYEKPGMPVELELDMKAYDLLALRERMARNHEARVDPARSLFNLRLRGQRAIRDQTGWDAESGAGTIKPHDLDAGWNVIKFVGAQYGTVEEIKAWVTDPVQQYAMALFGEQVSVSWLNSVAATPLVMDADEYGVWNVPAIQDDLAAHSYLEAWGEEAEPCGYSPGLFSKDHAVTGKVNDDVALQIASLDPPFLWLAVWVPAPCSFRARMKIAIQE